MPSTPPPSKLPVPVMVAAAITASNNRRRMRLSLRGSGHATFLYMAREYNGPERIIRERTPLRNSTFFLSSKAAHAGQSPASDARRWAILGRPVARRRAAVQWGNRARGDEMRTVLGWALVSVLTLLVAVTCAPPAAPAPPP